MPGENRRRNGLRIVIRERQQGDALQGALLIKPEEPEQNRDHGRIADLSEERCQFDPLNRVRLAARDNGERLFESLGIPLLKLQDQIIGPDRFCVGIHLSFQSIREFRDCGPLEGELQAGHETLLGIVVRRGLEKFGSTQVVRFPARHRIATDESLRDEFAEEG